MSNFFNKIVFETSNEVAAFESSKHKLQDRIAQSVENAEMLSNTDLLRLRKSKTFLSYIKA